MCIKKKEEEEDGCTGCFKAAFIRMGLSAESSVFLANVDRENLTDASLQYLDDNGIKTLCTLICKPGG
jgi:hypothetical protein